MPSKVTFRIHVDREQLTTLQVASELLAHVQVGRVEALAQLIVPQETSVRARAEIRVAVAALARRVAHVHHPSVDFEQASVPESARIAYDLAQALRLSTGISASPVSQVPMAIIEQVDEQHRRRSPGPRIARCDDDDAPVPLLMPGKP